MTSSKFNQLGFFRKSGLILTSLSILMIPISAHAEDSETVSTSADSYILDWDDYSETGIDRNQVNTFDIGGGTVDIEFLNPENFTEFGGATTPQINSILNGENTDSEKSLHLQIDPKDEISSITMKSRFSGFQKSLVNVSFILYDIDISAKNQWQDLVSLRGYGNEGQEVNPTFNILGDTLKASDANTLSGFESADNNSSRGNVEVSFRGINGFDLLFADGNDLNLSDQKNHGIGVGDIEVKDVPEPTAALALGIFAIAAFSKRKFAQSQL
ncbi:MAG: hypothetical protein F6K42_02055 [Leptolyngbya sp. SIO1D8]|nr:hypothetical protein [Leptolyngbya sp. SIO1D8]